MVRLNARPWGLYYRLMVGLVAVFSLWGTVAQGASLDSIPPGLLISSRACRRRSRPWEQCGIDLGAITARAPVVGPLGSGGAGAHPAQRPVLAQMGRLIPVPLARDLQAEENAEEEAAAAPVIEPLIRPSAWLGFLPRRSLLCASG